MYIAPGSVRLFSTFDDFTSSQRARERYPDMPTSVPVIGKKMENEAGFDVYGGEAINVHELRLSTRPASAIVV